MERILTYAQALLEGTEQEMRRDPSVFVYGLGVDDFKGIFGTTSGLLQKFGPERVFDTPLSEDAMTGVGIGAALAGLRPIHVHIRFDFLLLAMNQLVNIAAKSRYMYGGAVSVPLVVRAIIGRSWGQGAQHSQALHSLFMHIPGLRVVAPTTPYDAKGCLIHSIQDDNPVIFVEHRLLHFVKGHVPEEEYTVPFGAARVLAPGKDVTLVGISFMAVECMRARKHLAAQGIDAEVIDPISLTPLDIETIAKSVRKTGHLVVADNAWLSCGASAEIITRLMEHMGGTAFKAARVGFAPVTCPPTKILEDNFYPGPETVASLAHSLLRPNAPKWTPAAAAKPEAIEFRGPF
ncbi:MAG: transketolase C-terminal domain-containing protein [Verrucomicrobiota bacterium]